MTSSDTPAPAPGTIAALKMRVAIAIDELSGYHHESCDIRYVAVDGKAPGCCCGLDYRRRTIQQAVEAALTLAGGDPRQTEEHESRVEPLKAGADGQDLPRSNSGE